MPSTGGGTILSRQGQAPALASAKGLKCSFQVMALSTLRDEPPKAEVKPATLVMEFEEINADEGSARLKAGFGQYDIAVRYAQGYLHFIQSFRDGPVYVTTVLDQKTPGGKLKAMHSRHEYTAVSLPGYTSSPEQYYGECEVVK
jgi:glycerophosphoryl diester phosphodiesterase